MIEIGGTGDRNRRNAHSAGYPAKPGIRTERLYRGPERSAPVASGQSSPISPKPKGWTISSRWRSYPMSRYRESRCAWCVPRVTTKRRRHVQHRLLHTRLATQGGEEPGFSVPPRDTQRHVAGFPSQQVENVPLPREHLEGLPVRKRQPRQPRRQPIRDGTGDRRRFSGGRGARLPSQPSPSTARGAFVHAPPSLRPPVARESCAPGSAVSVRRSLFFHERKISVTNTRRPRARIMRETPERHERARGSATGNTDRGFSRSRESLDPTPAPIPRTARPVSAGDGAQSPLHPNPIPGLHEFFPTNRF